MPDFVWKNSCLCKMLSEWKEMSHDSVLMNGGHDSSMRKWNSQSTNINEKYDWVSQQCHFVLSNLIALSLALTGWHYNSWHQSQFTRSIYKLHHSFAQSFVARQPFFKEISLETPLGFLSEQKQKYQWYRNIKSAITDRIQTHHHLFTRHVLYRCTTSIARNFSDQIRVRNRSNVVVFSGCRRDRTAPENVGHRRRRRREGQSRRPGVERRPLERDVVVDGPGQPQRRRKFSGQKSSGPGKAVQ